MIRMDAYPSLTHIVSEVINVLSANVSAVNCKMTSKKNIKN